MNALAQRPSIAPDIRNPYRGKGLAVTLTLLLQPARRWSLAELADEAEVSRPLVSKVVRALRAADLVEGEVAQGRVACIRPRRALFWQTASQCVIPVAGVVGGHVPDDHPLGGGPAVASAFDIPWEALSRVYVRSVDDVPRLLARTGGWWSTGPVVDWEVAVVDVALAPGPVPPIVTALELAQTLRGREVLLTCVDDVLAAFPDS